MARRSLPTRTLPASPHLDQLKRQAKELLDAFRRGSAEAATEVRAHDRHADPARFALHDAQLVLARAYGFESWPKLKAFVDGVTIRRLVEVIADGDLAAVQAMIDARPELVHMDVAANDEHRALHHAVLRRRPEMVRLLMHRGADARKGIWPHRDATAPFTMAVERGYDEIVRIIETEERRRSAHPEITTVPPSVLAALSDAFRRSDEDGMIAVLQAHPQLVGLADPRGRTALHWASARLWPTLATWLIERGADASARSKEGATQRRDDRLIALLEGRGARLNPVGAAELGLIDQAARWLADAAQAGPAAAAHADAPDVARDLLWGATNCPAIVRLVLTAVAWPPDDRRWRDILENGLYLRPDSDRARHLEAFTLVLDRSDPNVQDSRGTTLLHEIAASRGGLTADDRVAYATLLLDRGARLDLRDDLLASTPLGWACRWGRVEMVTLLLDRGVDPIESDAEPWARPMAWAKKAGRRDVASVLDQALRRDDR